MSNAKAQISNQPQMLKWQILLWYRRKIMKSLLNEIRNQPEHVRHIFMWLCVVITFSVIGFIWFRSTSRQFVALMHPEQAQERALAEKNKPKQPSPFATILGAWGNLRANISELFVGPKSSLEINNGAPRTNKVELPPQKLPLSN